MAQDLEAAKNSNTKPLGYAQSGAVSQPLATTPQQDKRKLSEILAQAQNRMQAPPKAVEPPEPKEVLPIEPLDYARGKPLDLAWGKPLSEGQPPARQPTALREPPLNLPTGLPTGQAGSPSETLIARQEKLPQKPEITPSADIKRALSPEEILGLTKPELQETNLPEETPVKEWPAPSRAEGPPAESLSLSQSPKKNLFSTKFVLIAAFFGIIIAAAAGGVYWKFFIPKTPTELEPPDIILPPQIIEQPLPEALISYAEIEFVEIDKISYSALKPQLETLKNTSFPEESLIYVPIKLKTEKEVSYLTLGEFFDGLQINVPAKLLAQIRDEFTVFLYSQDAESERLCVDTGIPDKQCYGPRLGIVIRIYDANQTFSTMRDWEKTMVGDLRPIMLYEPQERPGGSFKAGKYNDLETNFINLPIPTMSIDWILSDNYLIIATSKKAARKAADRLK